MLPAALWQITTGVSMLAGTLLRSAWKSRGPILPSPPNPIEPFGKLTTLLQGDPYLQFGNDNVVLLLGVLLSGYQHATSARVSLGSSSNTTSSTTTSTIKQQQSVKGSPPCHPKAEGNSGSNSSICIGVGKASHVTATAPVGGSKTAARTTGAVRSSADMGATALLSAVDWAWADWQIDPEAFLKHALAGHMVAQGKRVAGTIKLGGPEAGKVLHHRLFFIRVLVITHFPLSQ